MRSSQLHRSGKFRFRKNSSIGAADAIDDAKYLAQSFIDTGDLEILRNADEPKCIIVGRTGAGKTALLEKLKNVEERVINIDPDNLALTYIANNGVLKFFMELGVNLDIFYRLLWRHVFAVELIKARYQIVDEQSNETFFQQIRDRLAKNRPKRSALDYLRKWGERFWLETDYRITEITKRLSEELGESANAVLKGAVPGIGVGTELNANLIRFLSEDQKVEIIHRGQKVVNDVQIAELSRVIELLDQDILEDRQKKYYIALDRLDENWINDDLRFHLIRALLETIKVFNSQVENVKIIAAVREDLLHRVFKYSRDPGYQEEKYRSMYLMLAWRENELVELLDLRVNQLIEEQYTTQKVTLKKLLPPSVTVNGNRIEPIAFMIERTFLRPRDVIAFFNECIRAAQGQPRINRDALSKAEEGYSFGRIGALADEWRADYPYLRPLIACLKEFRARFALSDVETVLQERLLDLVTSDDYARGIDSPVLDEMLMAFEKNDPVQAIQSALRVLYRVGVVGIKREAYLGTYWSWEDKPYPGAVRASTLVIHPAMWRSLGIQPA